MGTLRKSKWILFAGYNPQKSKISYFLNIIGKVLDRYLGHYENLILLGDFNSKIKEEKIKEFCESYSLKNLIKEPTCYKNVLNPTSIDLILTNRSKSFYESIVIETGISDFHKMTVTVLKTYLKKMNPKYIRYRNYKNFNQEIFRTELQNQLTRINDEVINYDLFREVFMNLLNKHAPTK